MHSARTGRSGELYRDDQGQEVWRVIGSHGAVIAVDIASDHDARFIVTNGEIDEQLTTGQEEEGS